MSAPLTVDGLNPTERTKCERFTRIMGYMRPMDAANPGKQQEFADRQYYRYG